MHIALSPSLPLSYLPLASLSLTVDQHACMHASYLLTIHEADQSLHEVVHELERAGLLAVAVDSDVLALQRLHSEHDMGGWKTNSSLSSTFA